MEERTKNELVTVQPGKGNYKAPVENQPQKNCCPIHVHVEVGFEKDEADYELWDQYSLFGTCRVGKRECKTYNPCIVGCLAIPKIPCCLVDCCAKNILCIECKIVE